LAKNVGRWLIVARSSVSAYSYPPTIRGLILSGRSYYHFDLARGEEKMAKKPRKPKQKRVWLINPQRNAWGVQALWEAERKNRVKEDKKQEWKVRIKRFE